MVKSIICYTTSDRKLKILKQDTIDMSLEVGFLLPDSGIEILVVTKSKYLPVQSVEHYSSD